MRGAALCLLFSAGLRAQPAAFHGTAINSQTGKPLAGVHVRLMLAGFDGPAGVYGAMSDRDGQFSIDPIQPGTYIVLPEKAGFVFMRPSKGAPANALVTVKAGEHAADFRLKMTPRVVIAGRVLDEYGDPVENVMVTAMPVSADAPVEMQGFGRTGRTDDRGEFRLSGGPGKFYVKATPPEDLRPPEVRTDGTSEAAYGPTYYPNATGASRAAAVEADAGSDVSGIEIQLVRQRKLTVNGVVTGNPPGASAAVTMRYGESEGRLDGLRQVTTEPGGHFSFGPMLPAFCRVYASVNWGSTRLMSRVVEVRPDGPEAVNLELALIAGGELTGTLEITGDPPGNAGKRTVVLHPASYYELDVADRSGETGESGAFQVAGVMPGRYRVKVEPLPENGYIRSVTLDGVAAAGGVVDLSHGVDGSRLRIALGRDGAQISGNVLEKDGQRVSTALAMVFLLASPEDFSPEMAQRMTPEGRYGFKGIAPGKYRLFAVDMLRSGPLAGREDLEKLWAAAEEIEIKEGQSLTKDVKVLLKEDLDAVPK